MKSKSIQESLFEQILAIEECSFPSFNCSDKFKQRHRSDICSTQQMHALPKFKYAKHQPRSIADLEDDLLRMYANAAKNSSNNRSKRQSTQKTKRTNNKMRTQISQQQGPPMNYSTIYTRRSSLDESLYDKALREQSSRKSWISRKQRQKQQNQLKPCLHKPSINQTSKQIMKQINKQQLYNKIKKKKQESAKRIIEQSQKRQMNQCSFTPNINKSQKKMAKSIKVESFIITQDTSNVKPTQRNSINIFDQLYQDSKSRQIKIKERQTKHIKQRVSKPLIDQISKQITKNTDFESRMLNYEKRKLQKEIVNQQKQNNYSKQLYRPSINTNSHNRKKQSLSIGEHLYLQSKREKNSQNLSVKTPTQDKIQVNKKSNRVYEQRKVLVFYQLFKLLDGDEDGAISITNISLDSLPHQVVKIIYPLIEELEVMQVELHEHQFIGSIQNLFKTLTIHEKDILLGFIGESKQQENADLFKPKINSKSRIIAACNQRAQMSIYEYCSIKEAQKQKQLETERIQKSKRELQKCTFQPKVFTRYKC